MVGRRLDPGHLDPAHVRHLRHTGVLTRPERRTPVTRPDIALCPPSKSHGCLDGLVGAGAHRRSFWEPKHVPPGSARLELVVGRPDWRAWIRNSDRYRNGAQARAGAPFRLARRTARSVGR